MLFRTRPSTNRQLFILVVVHAHEHLSRRLRAWSSLQLVPGYRLCFDRPSMQHHHRPKEDGNRLGYFHQDCIIAFAMGARMIRLMWQGLGTPQHIQGLLPTRHVLLISSPSVLKQAMVTARHESATSVATR